MEIVATFGVALVVAALVSGLAARSWLSTSLLVLLAGALLGPGGVGLLAVRPGDHVVTLLAEVALVAVLFTDGHRLPLQELRHSARLGSRALLLAMPLTVFGIAGGAMLLTDLSWVQALLVGAVLSPTDPVFASAIVQREDVPERLRRLLNVESGINDGLALPLVVILLAQQSTPRGSVEPLTLAAELFGGLALGVALPVVVAGVTRVHAFNGSAAPALLALGLAVTIFGVAELTHANPFLAAFAGGVTAATVLPHSTTGVGILGEQLAESAKLLALLVFGALLTPPLLGQVPVGGWVLAALSLLLVRPAAMLLSLSRSSLPRRQRAAAAWFGPKGFASVVYGLLVLESGTPHARLEFVVIAACVAVSVVVHSSTDVAVARRFTRREEGATAGR